MTPSKMNRADFITYITHSRTKVSYCRCDDCVGGIRPTRLTQMKIAAIELETDRAMTLWLYAEKYRKAKREER